MAKRGIDISAHNGDIDLSALKSQIDFVIIRVGYGTKGTIDTKFKRNTELCQSLGIPYGFYWYSYALDIAGANREAYAFLNAIAPYHPTMGCWFDMEDADSYKRKNGMPSNQTLQDMCYEFCEIVENAGYYTGVYASLSWLNNQLAGDRLSRFAKWVAQWPTSGGKQIGLDVNPDSRTGVALWQFTSVGRFAGYNGNLDTNYAYIEFTNPGSEPVPEPTPAPQPTPAPTGSTLELAIRTLNGEFGNGEDRVLALGERYGEVQDFINHIASASVSTLAQEVIDGKYGDGDTRKVVLGDKYNEVQSEVNDILSPKSKPLEKGARIKFTGTKSYSGIRLADWVHNDVFNVIEVSGDRVVIGKGTVVTAAVNAKDCEVL